MRFLFSYGLAIVIVLVLGAWLATGMLVTPGNGPGNGETPVLVALEGEDGGPVTQALEATGLVKPEHEAGHDEDPTLTIAQREAEQTGADAPARSVRIATYTMQAMPIEVPLRGRTKARSVVSIMPETAGTVKEVKVEKGQTVAAGDLLCVLDQGTRAAAVAQAEAGLAQAQSALVAAQTAFDANKELRDKGLAPANSGQSLESQVRAAQASVAAAQSGLDNARAELDRTEVVASVGGVIQDPLASVGSMLGPQAPCATVVQLDPMLFVGTVPEARIQYAKLGLPATVHTVTGKTAEGEVTYIASVADESTRSFAVEIAFANPDGDVLSGITANAVVNVGTAPAHLLPQSVLTLDDEGVLGVRAVKDSIVEFYPVTIMSDTRDGIWVTGLPPKVDVITVGQEYVQQGQVVNAGYGPDETETAEAETADSAETAGETH
jgi:multidrug efflux system membrane fusion protein